MLSRPIDLAVIVAYLAGVTWFGARFRKGQRSLKDYFLGGGTAPWWAIALSIVSAETSTLTIIGTPPLAYGGSFVFLQVVFGYLARAHRHLGDTPAAVFQRPDVHRLRTDGAPLRQPHA